MVLPRSFLGFFVHVFLKCPVLAVALVAVSIAWHYTPYEIDEYLQELKVKRYAIPKARTDDLLSNNMAVYNDMLATLKDDDLEAEKRASAKDLQSKILMAEGKAMLADSRDYYQKLKDELKAGEEVAVKPVQIVKIFEVVSPSAINLMKAKEPEASEDENEAIQIKRPKLGKITQTAYADICRKKLVSPLDEWRTVRSSDLLLTQYGNAYYDYLFGYLGSMEWAEKAYHHGFTRVLKIWKQNKDIKNAKANWK